MTMTELPPTPEVKLHPRVEQQGIDHALVEQLLLSVNPRFLPFGGKSYTSAVAVLDWDHRLPSRALIIRVHLFYAAPTREWFDDAFLRRKKEIDERNRFPEFDVPDYLGLPADEAYDVELNAANEVAAIRLVSAWRRDVPQVEANRAIGVVRTSAVFKRIATAFPERSPQLGDLEAVSWMAPVETGHTGWAVDVWWLIAFDGRVGKGWSFIVDPDGVVLTSKEFTVRAQ